MTNYRLSPAAEQDLIEIAVFGIEQFGIAQAERYRDKLQQRFQQLAEKPHHYRS
ncbi:type II toxin-antitoxin system RelE/ParE family toxin [Maribrevibacterium harenarium]|uniref:Type II toxin-antitoxin system RelE/ParE family toxin n=1 Tax=Maribrevibacterium harenarium TaxID=2589817 RepID=A0A501WQH6_9GAMM|nr:type II toxin-antitoxin system RelE/ParE family toxin [Maribrevibacterium harenarium]